MLKLTPFVLLILLSSCAAFQPTTDADQQPDTEPLFDLSELPESTQRYADSLLTQGLDHEALFSLKAPLKPMSDIKLFTLPYARPDSLPSGSHYEMDPDTVDISELQKMHTIAEELSNDVLLFAIFPIKNLRGTERVFQLKVINIGAYRQMVATHQHYWINWGVTPESHPFPAIQLIEYEEMGDRFRGYGYLYGYPDHAVDFFVEAAHHEQETGDFVERDFFQIPTYAEETGRFVYALEEDSDPEDIDEEIKVIAADILSNYQDLRKDYVYDDTSEIIHAVKFLNDQLSNTSDEVIHPQYVSPSENRFAN